MAAVATLGLSLSGAPPTGARPLSGATGRAATAGAAARSTPITPAHGAPFVPRLGDWEGRVNGFPVSLEILRVPRFQTVRHLPPYGFRNLVALEPSTCPPSAGRYSEVSIAVGTAGSLGRRGSFGLTPLGFGGGLKSAASAVLETTFRVSSSQDCSGSLVWHLRPANRIAVPDGRWRARYSDGESSAFTVRDGGRLATKLRLPAALAACGGPIGAVDVFIGARGNVAVSEPEVDLGMHFSGAAATGRFSVPGATCHRPPLTMTASPG
jgi:hypothetical protein